MTKNRTFATVQVTNQDILNRINDLHSRHDHLEKLICSNKAACENRHYVSSFNIKLLWSLLTGLAASSAAVAAYIIQKIV